MKRQGTTSKERVHSRTEQRPHIRKKETDNLIILKMTKDTNKPLCVEANKEQTNTRGSGLTSKWDVWVAVRI